MSDRLVWVFDDFELDLRAWRLSRAGRALPLEPKALALLGLLVERQGDVVTKAEILDQVWKDTAVTENAMVRVIAQIRAALRDDSKEPKFIETVHTRGYRFRAPVTRADAPPVVPGSRWPAINVRAAVLAFALLAIAAASAYYLRPGPEPAPSGTVAVAASNTSLAILPLENLGPPAHQYFADGMTEALTTQLAKIEALKVMSRSAVIRYRENRPLPSVIAHELGVARLVEGSALLTSDRVRITARLIDGATNQALWAESYEGDLRDVLALQGQVAREIAREIRVRVTPEEDKRLSSSRAVNPTAYQDYLLGLYAYERALAVDRNMFSHLEEALQRFRSAATLEPGWGEAHGALAQTHMRLAEMSDNHAERLRQSRLADDVAQHALELDPNVVRARVALARVPFFLKRDWDSAERQYLEVLRLEPNNADWGYGIFLSYAGRFDESLVRLRNTLERWPTSPFTGYQIGVTYLCARRYDEAQAEANVLRTRFGDDLHATLLDGMVQLGRGQYATAVDTLEGRRKELMVNWATTFLQHLAYAAARANQPALARGAVEELVKRGGRPMPPVVLVMQGRDAAIRQIQEFGRQRDYALLQARCWVDYDSLRAIPEIATALREAGVSDPQPRKP
jgi:TolB-like protein/DNA-binding winged helix-turn-helix (wHTH) protein